MKNPTQTPMVAHIGAWYRRWGGPRLIVAVVLAVLVGLSLRDGILRPGSANLHAHQASAFLQGRLDVPEYEEYLHDLAEYKGRKYVVFPPFPSALLMPFVAAFGMEQTRVVLICIALTILSIAVLRRILVQLETGRELQPWLLAAFFLGTAYWFCLANSAEVYYYAHLTAVTCILLAIHEALGRGRAWLVGFCLGAALLSRQLSLYSSIFLCAAMWCNPAEKSWRRKIADIAVFGICFGACMGIYCFFNFARFGNMADTGYQYMPLQDFLAARVEKYGVFNLAYVPFNFIHMFVQGFHVSFVGPELLVPEPDRFGTSLTIASPFVFVAFMARGPRLLLAAAWASVALTLAHHLFYYNNGFVQLNAQRFTLDFMPVLIVLVALGAGRCSAPLVKGLIAFAVVLNLITMVGIPLFNSNVLR